MVRYYRDSLARALQEVYPTHYWHVWKFRRAPKGFWKDKRNAKKFFDWVMEELNMQSLDGWYNISVEQVYKLGGSSLELP
jgi:hypothetical protein